MDTKRAQVTEEHRKLAIKLYRAGRDDNARFDHTTQLLADALAAVRRQTLEEAAKVIDHEIEQREKFTDHMTPIDELAAIIRALAAKEGTNLEQHYIHKDKVRVLRDQYQGMLNGAFKGASGPVKDKGGRIVLELVIDELSALLGGERT